MLKALFSLVLLALLLFMGYQLLTSDDIDSTITVRAIQAIRDEETREKAAEVIHKAKETIPSIVDPPSKKEVIQDLLELRKDPDPVRKAELIQRIDKNIEALDPTQESEVQPESSQQRIPQPAPRTYENPPTYDKPPLKKAWDALIECENCDQIENGCAKQDQLTFNVIEGILEE